MNDRYWDKVCMKNGLSVYTRQECIKMRKGKYVNANKKSPMMCKCSQSGAHKVCKCNVPDLPQIHNKCVLTTFH